MTCKGIPNIKEDRIHNLVNALLCISNNQFNRKEQIKCVLTNYPKSKSGEKGVFRGMILTTLGIMGLILNYGRLVKPSENGNLLIKSSSMGEDIHRKVISHVFWDIDNEIFGFLDVISKSKGIKSEIMAQLMKLTVNCSQEQMKERVTRWLRVLKSAQLVLESNDLLKLNSECIENLRRERDSINSKTGDFSEILFSTYSEIVNISNRIVDIEELRIKTSEKFLKRYKLPVTRLFFDELLLTIINEDKEFEISLGHSMGKGEKLLKMNNDYYKTIYIRKREV